MGAHPAVPFLFAPFTRVFEMNKNELRTYGVTDEAQAHVLTSADHSEPGETIAKAIARKIAEIEQKPPVIVADGDVRRDWRWLGGMLEGLKFRGELIAAAAAE